jgi:hypothetical protein
MVWVFKGTRTPVAVVFENLEDGMTIDELIPCSGPSTSSLLHDIRDDLVV